MRARGLFVDEAVEGEPERAAQRTLLGAVKRAQLNLARERPDLLYALPEDKVVALADAPLPHATTARRGPPRGSQAAPGSVLAEQVARLRC